MSRFNTTLASPRTKTTNLAGSEAYKQTDKMEIVSILLTSFAQDKFYRKSSDEFKRLDALIRGECNKEFIAKAILFARKKFGMRSISHVASAIIADSARGEKWTRSFFKEVIHRPDDALEILSFYKENYCTSGKLRKIPIAMQRGLSAGLAKFNAYQLAKYRGEGKAMKLVDAVNILHVKPSEANTNAFRSLMKGELKSEDTWEARLTAAGQDAEKRFAVWNSLISEKKLGYFALLRNLRNIAKDAPSILPKALEILTDEKLIKDPKNLVLPFRYLTAMKEMSTDMRIVAALSDALEISLSNVPRFAGETLIALDTSGSMQGQPSEIGSIFAAVFAKSNYADIHTFDTSARAVKFNPRDSVMSIARSIPFSGGGTDFRVIFDTIHKKYDRIIILSDMQAWVGGHAPKAEFNSYKERSGADPAIFCFDLQGYGTLQFPENRVYQLAGFNEAILDIMPMLEEDRNALAHEIDKIQIRGAA